MRKSGFFMPAIALIAGVAGFFLRRQEIPIFDPYTGLPEQWAPVSIALMALSGGVVILLLLLCFQVQAPKRPILTFEAAFGGNRFASTFLTILGVLVILATVLDALTFPDPGRFPLLFYLQTGLAFLAGFCLCYMALRGPRGSNVAPASAVPVFWLCLLLVVFHIGEASNPVLLQYAYGFFALSAILLSLYYLASFAFHQGKIRKFLFSSSAAVYFIGVTMGDPRSLYQAILLLALAATLLVYHLALLHAFSRPEPEESFPHLRTPPPLPYVPPPVSEHKKPYWDVDLD